MHFRNIVAPLLALLAASSSTYAQWTATVLHPAGAMYSSLEDVDGSQQVGLARIGSLN
jgi:hypothetical protein